MKKIWILGSSPKGYRKAAKKIMCREGYRQSSKINRKRNRKGNKQTTKN
jgi:hypothetical protein